MNDIERIASNPLRKSWKLQTKLPARMDNVTLDDVQDIPRVAMDSVLQWMKLFKTGDIVANFNSKKAGMGLLLCGEPGRGKTTLVAAIINNLLATAPHYAFGPSGGTSGVTRRATRFITWNDYGRLVGQAMSDEEADVQLDRICARNEVIGQWVRLLAIDDLGKEHQSGTTWNPTLLHDLLRTRFNEGLPTIVTTNVPPAQLENFYGAATASYFKEALLTVPILGKDLR